MSDPHLQHAQSVLRSMEEQVAARLAAAQQHAPNSKPILRLYRTLHDLFAQSEVYSLDGDDARCYMMLSTTMRYYLSIIKKHPAFSDRIVAADKAKAQALCEKIMTRMERMRAELLQHYEQESREAERDAKREAQQREEMAREQAERDQAAALAATFAPTSPSPTPPAVAVAALTSLPPLQPPILPLAAVSADLPPGDAATAAADADALAADVAMPSTATAGDGGVPVVMSDTGFTPALNPFASLSSAAAPSPAAPLTEDSSLDAFANMEAARIITTPKPAADLLPSSSVQPFSIEPDAPMMDSTPAAAAETEASAPPPPPATSPYATGAAVAGMAAISAASTVVGAASAGASLAGGVAGVAATAGAGVSALSSLSSSSSSAPSVPAATASRAVQPAATWTAPSAAAASAPPPSVPAAAVSGYPALQQKAAAAGTWPPPPPPLPAASAPPPVAAAASSGSAAPSAAAKPRQRAVPPMPTTLRPIHLPSNVLGDFYAFARANTDANIETCGILCGHLDEDDPASSKGFRITHVLIPNQTATADTCVTTNEEDLISLQMQYDLLTLGWIHTHPSQTCFLSSVDLHTHYTYQLMLPEAIAIVLAPRFQPNQGVFHCTLPGMKALTGCSRSGFHKHEEKFPLYSLAPHVCWENGADRKAKFIDLRTKRAAQPQQQQQQPQQPQQWRPPVQQQQQQHMHPHPQQQMMHPQQMQQRPMGGFHGQPQPLQGYGQLQSLPPPHQHRPGGPPHVHR